MILSEPASSIPHDAAGIQANGRPWGALARLSVPDTRQFFLVVLLARSVRRLVCAARRREYEEMKRGTSYEIRGS
jgi:hypothetical protein